MPDGWGGRLVNLVDQCGAGEVNYEEPPAALQALHESGECRGQPVEVGNHLMTNGRIEGFRRDRTLLNHRLDDLHTSPLPQAVPAPLHHL